MDEDKTEDKTKGEEKPTEDSKEGVQPKVPKVVEQTNAAAERIEEANKKSEELLERAEELKAHQMLSGDAEAGSEPEKPKRLTDTEYAEALERGEVNPLKEDGFI